MIKYRTIDTMKRLLQFLFFSILSCTVLSQTNTAKFDYFIYKGLDDYYKEHPLNKKNMFFNPILPGWYSDPSICTNGEDYFLVTSTFGYYPGVPIFHSKDLVNWKQIGNVLNRPSQLKLDGQNAGTGGIYAPAIEYNPYNKTYYMITTNVGSGNFFVKTKDPFGDWSEPIALPDVHGIDPSFFFDEDGRAYIVNNDAPDGTPLYDGHRAIKIHEFDVKADKTIGKEMVIVNGGVRIEDKPVWIEGPHLYKIKGLYYLMAAEGGTGVNHSEVIFRSSSPMGPFEPWEKNPILTQRTLSAGRSNPVTCSGHADLIQTKDGEWWAFFLACRPVNNNFENLGRETFMMPVTWSEDGYPYMTSYNEAVPLVFEKKGVERSTNPNFGNFEKKDNFSSSSLGYEWMTLRGDASHLYSLKNPSGYLALKCADVSSIEKRVPAFVCRRMQHHKFECSTKMTFTPTDSGEAAGLLLFKDEWHQYFMAVRGTKQKRYVSLEKIGKEECVELAKSTLNESFGPVFLKVISNETDYDFYYSTQEGTWQLLCKGVDARYLSTANAGGFTGTTIGMYATSKGVSKPYKLWYTTPAEYVGDKSEPTVWEKYSLPIGNGYMGASVFGRTDTERIQLTEKTLCNKGLYGIAGLTNFAELYFDFGHKNVDNYYRDLNLENAVASVSYDCNGVHYGRSYFMSYPDNVMVVRLNADKRKSLSFKLRALLPNLREIGEENDGRTGKVVSGKNTLCFSGKMSFLGLNYEGQVRVIPKGGRVKSLSDGTIEVKDADEAILFIVLGTNYHLSPELFMEQDFSKKLDASVFPHDRLTDAMEKVTKKGYESLLRTHIEDYTNLFNRVSVEFNNSNSVLPTDSLLHEYARGKQNQYLEELIFQYGRYLLIASSRENTLPCNLQGVWSQYDMTPWTGGYWHNINIQMNYWPAFNTNLAETFMAYVKYNDAFRKHAEHLATQYVKQNNPETLSDDGNGWTIGTAATPYFISEPSGHSGPGTGGMTTKLFWDYYDFTKDTVYLKEKAFPTIYGISKFLSKVVKPSADGHLLAYPSASPEQPKSYTSAWDDYYQTSGSTFDQGFIWENHSDLLKAAKLLHYNDPFIEFVNKQILKLDPILIGKSGQIKEFREEEYYGEIGEPEHRHISQLCPLYPGTLINSSTKDWLEAAKITLDRRGDRSTGWGMAHRMNARARTKEGNRAYDLFRKVIIERTNENLWMVHPPFQIDASLGCTAGVAEMLLQSHEGYIDILPALPFIWRKGKFTGLVARGNFVVDVQWSDMKPAKVNILSRSGGTCRVKSSGLAGMLLSDTSGNEIPFRVEEHSIVSFETEKGKQYEFNSKGKQ